MKNTSSKKDEFDGPKIVSILVIVFIIGLLLSYKEKYDAISEFKNGNVLICTDKLVSKDKGYFYDEDKDTFINKDDNFIFFAKKCKPYKN